MKFDAVATGSEAIWKSPVDVRLPEVLTMFAIPSGRPGWKPFKTEFSVQTFGNARLVHQWQQISKNQSIKLWIHIVNLNFRQNLDRISMINVKEISSFWSNSVHFFTTSKVHDPIWSGICRKTVGLVDFRDQDVPLARSSWFLPGYHGHPTWFWRFIWFLTILVREIEIFECAGRGFCRNPEKWFLSLTTGPEGDFGRKWLILVWECRRK